MENKSDLDYQKMKEFLLFFLERYVRNDSLPPEKRPIAILESLEKKNIRMAFDGLRQAIGDCIQMSLIFDKGEVRELDIQLYQRGIFTLSELRRRYAKDYAKIIKRDKIKNDNEYYMMRNILDDQTEKDPDELSRVRKLISDYESACGRFSPSP